MLHPPGSVGSGFPPAIPASANGLDTGLRYRIMFCSMGPKRVQMPSFRRLTPPFFPRAVGAREKRTRSGAEGYTPAPQGDIGEE